MMLVPKLFTTIKDYDSKTFFSDLSSGVILGIIAIPLSIAFAISSGVSPEKGIIAAIIGGGVVSLLGGSRVQIAGPTGAFVALIYGIVVKFGVSGLILSTIMAGIFLLIMGVLKLGTIIKFIPHSITSGFTSGIAVLIFTNQINDITGLKADNSLNFFEKWLYYFKNISNVSYITFLLFLICIFCLFVWPKINKKIPSSIIIILLSILINNLFNLRITTIGSAFGDLSLKFNLMDFSSIQFSDIQILLIPAISIAILGGIESLLSAVVADGMIGGNHRSNMELIAQGTANVLCAMFGGIPVTGAIARTAANVKNGGRTPVSGIIHSLTILIIMIFLTPYLKHIPLVTLASILIFVSINMFEIESFKNIKNNHAYDNIVFILTFILTFAFDLIIAIQVGIIFSAFLFMKRMMEVSKISYFKEEIEDKELNDKLHFSSSNNFKGKVEIYEINGPFFFAAAENLLKINSELNYNPELLVLKMTQVPFIDSTALNTLNRFAISMKKRNTKVCIAEADIEVKKLILKNEIENVFFVDKMKDIIVNKD